MAQENHNPLDLERSLREQLKDKGRRRRDGLARMAAPGAAPRTLRKEVMPELKITMAPLDELRSPARKVRAVDPAHVREVAAAISAFGFCDPILISKNKTVIDGEVRLEAAKLLGLDRAPCLRIDHLSDNEQRLLRLAVNRLGEKGQWCLDELKIEFEDLIVADAAIEYSGFSLDEIDSILIGDEVDAVEQGPLAPQTGSVAVARLGDMFMLGPHRLICGDARHPKVLKQLMDGDPAARLILTDEPYNVRIAGRVKSRSHREFSMASGEMSDTQFLDFNVAWIQVATACLCDGGIFGTFIDWRGLDTVHSAATQLGLAQINLIVWEKTNAGQGSLYRSQHELLPLFKKGGAPHVNNVKLGKRGRWRSNVWTYPGASSPGSDARRGLQDHPTVKPTAMLVDALLDVTDRGDIVLDPFLGSGSTLIAANKAERVCRGVELDPLYVDVIVRRYQACTGCLAVLAETGETLEALTARRARETAPV